MDDRRIVSYIKFKVNLLSRFFISVSAFYTVKYYRYVLGIHKLTSYTQFTYIEVFWIINVPIQL